MIKTIADTIICLAKERMKSGSYKNINSAIHEVRVEIGLKLIEFMKDQKIR